MFHGATLRMRTSMTLIVTLMTPNLTPISQTRLVQGSYGSFRS